jgi:hypothetical protein
LRHGVARAEELATALDSAQASGATALNVVSSALFYAHRHLIMDRAASAPGKPQGRQGRPGIIHSSVYLPEAVYEALRRVAFEERVKIHDIVLEGIELALRKRDRRRR